MKGNQGKKKHSKLIFLKKKLAQKKSLQQIYLTNKLKKWVQRDLNRQLNPDKVLQKNNHE